MITSFLQRLFNIIIINVENLNQGSISYLNRLPVLNLSKITIVNIS
jgi:hypothetical protein